LIKVFKKSFSEKAGKNPAVNKTKLPEKLFPAARPVNH
jgi:hypothetical protein